MFIYNRLGNSFYIKDPSLLKEFLLRNFHVNHFFIC